MSVDSRDRTDEEVDSADWSADSDRGRPPSPGRLSRPRRQRQASPQMADVPFLQPADEERATSLLAELTRGTCQLPPFPF